jgi:hypothetical protein
VERRFWLILVLVIVIVVGVVLTANFVFSSLFVSNLRYAIVKSEGFKEDDFYIYYLAVAYVGDEDIRASYVRIPKPSPYKAPLLIDLAWRRDSEIKSLEIEFTPPPSKFVDLAWISTTITAPVEFYKNGPVITWRCRDLGFYGKGTLTLEFIPALPNTDFTSYTIHIKALVEYKGVDYIVEHSFIIGASCQLCKT